MRVGDGDGREASERAHRLDRGVVEQADAIPQDVPARRLHQQGALADGEGWSGADAGQAGLKRADFIGVSLLQFGQGGPFLAVEADVLALVQADGTGGGWLGGGGELSAAGFTDEML